MESWSTFELHVTREWGDVTQTALYANESGQLSLLASEEWGPFSTKLEVAQWVIRAITLAVDAASA